MALGWVGGGDRGQISEKQNGNEQGARDENELSLFKACSVNGFVKMKKKLIMGQTKSNTRKVN